MGSGWNPTENLEMEEGKRLTRVERSVEWQEEGPRDGMTSLEMK